MHAVDPNSRSPDVAGNQEQLERLFDAALDAVIAMDSEGAVAAWNRTAEKIFGWTRAEVLGRQLAQTIIPEHLRAAHYAGLQRYHSTRTGPVINTRIEVPAIRRDGSEFPVELTIIPLELEGGEIFYAFLRDITERKRAERLVEQRALEAQVLYEAASLVAQGGSADELLTGCMAKICEVTGWTVGHVYRPDPPLNPSRLVPTNIWHIGDPRLESLRAAAAYYAMGKGEGLPGRIWASGAPVWIEDLRSEPNLPRRELLASHGLRSAFGVPILLEGQIQAVLEFFSPLAQRPDDSLMLVAQSLAEQLGRVLERQRALEHQQLLMRELDHRVSNSMAVVASVFRRTAERAGSLDELTEAFEARLSTLAGAHHVLARGAWSAADLRDVIEATLSVFATERSDYLLAGPDVRLPAHQVIDFTMVMHELATNAAKYGALSVVGGKVAITWQATEGSSPPQVAISWQELGGPPVREQQEQGQGFKLMQKLITRGLAGQIQMAFRPPGLEAVITFPIAASDRS